MTHIGIILRGQTQHLVIVNDNNGGNFRAACSGDSIRRSGPDCP